MYCNIRNFYYVEPSAPVRCSLPTFGSPSENSTLFQVLLLVVFVSIRFRNYSNSIQEHCRRGIASDLLVSREGVMEDSYSALYLSDGLNEEQHGRVKTSPPHAHNNLAKNTSSKPHDKKSSLDELGVETCAVTTTGKDKGRNSRITHLVAPRQRRAKYPQIRSRLAVQSFDEAKEAAERRLSQEFQVNRYGTKNAVNAVRSRYTRREYALRLEEGIMRKKAYVQNFREKIRSQKLEVEHLKNILWPQIDVNCFLKVCLDPAELSGN